MNDKTAQPQRGLMFLWKRVALIFCIFNGCALMYKWTPRIDEWLWQLEPTFVQWSALLFFWFGLAMLTVVAVLLFAITLLDLSGRKTD